MKGNVHIAPLALPPVVNVAQGVVPGLVVSLVVVSGCVVVSQTVPGLIVNHHTIICQNSLWQVMIHSMINIICNQVNLKINESGLIARFKVPVQYIIDSET